ncbi:MAG: hypothetical protein HRT66_05250 [Flavobacteriaceae bacterium]|nr:hypothetical protein [Flavobacteriaceae bacterium]
MKNEMNNWEDLWSQQKASNINIDELANKLHKIERITKFQRLFFLFVLVFVFYSMFTHLSLNIYNYISFGLVLIGFLFVLVPLFGNKINYDNKNTNQFIESQIKYLRKKLLIPKIYSFVFVVLIIIALNIGFWGASEQLDVFYRILFHLSTVVIFIVFVKLRKVGIRNYEKEISSIIDKLEEIRKEG